MQRRCPEGSYELANQLMELVHVKHGPVVREVGARQVNLKAIEDDFCDWVVKVTAAKTTFECVAMYVPETTKLTDNILGLEQAHE